MGASAEHRDSINLEDLPKADDSEFRGLKSLLVDRRQLFGRALGGAVALSLTSVNLLPPARRAYASHTNGGGAYGYRIAAQSNWPNHGGCPPASRPSASCSRGCAPSKICGTNVSDGPCCVPPGFHKFGYHKHASFSSGNDWKLRPSQCTTSPSFTDGWLWKFNGSCGCCKGGIKYRCHDGWRLNSDGSNCCKRICRHTVSCDPPYC